MPNTQIALASHPRGVEIDQPHRTSPVGRERQVSVTAGRARVLDLGDRAAPPVVLLHGLGTVAEEMMTPLGVELARRNLRVLAVDRPAYGLSDPLGGSRHGPAAQGRWLGDVLDALGLRKPVIVAHSSGAAVALAFAAGTRRPLGGLVFLSPFSRPTRPAPMPLLRLATLPVAGVVFSGLIRAAAPWLGPRMLASAASPASVDRASLRHLPWRRMGRRRAIVAMKEELRAFNHDMAAIRTSLKRVRCPISLFAGSQDPVLPMRPQVAWIQRRARQVSVHMLDGEGHLLHHTHPACVAEAVIDILRRGHGECDAERPVGGLPA